MSLLRTLLLTAVFFAGWAAAAATSERPAQARGGTCAPLETAMAGLAQQYGETPVWGALSVAGHRLVTTGNPVSGTWTQLRVWPPSAGGPEIACLDDWGGGWRSETPEAQPL